MALVTRSFSESVGDREVLVEFIDGCGDEEETYEEVWQHVNEKDIAGWKLHDLVEGPGGVVELLWDRPLGGRGEG